MAGEQSHHCAEHEYPPADQEDADDAAEPRSFRGDFFEEHVDCNEGDFQKAADRNIEGIAESFARAFFLGFNM
jgi:hypothetical protein